MTKPGECAHIVIVDDNPLDQTLVLLALKRGNVVFEATTFDDGEEALRYMHECASSRPPDLVILDLMLPKVDGADVLAAMKSSKELMHVPVILMTALAPSAHQAAALGLSIQSACCLTKPSNLAQLRAFEEALLAACEEIATLPSARPSIASDGPLAGGS